MKKWLAILSMLTGMVFCSGIAHAQTTPEFVITGPDGSSEVTYGQVGDVVYLELRSLQEMYGWGNQLVEFNTDKLECVSIEEYIDAWYGPWNWWTPATADAWRGEPGIYSLYYYDQNGLGSDWEQEWVSLYGQNNAGPSASYDNATGQIRIYYSGYVGYYDPTDPIQSYPIRIGFKVKSASPISFTVYSNMLTSYNWYKDHMDSITVSVVDFVTEEDTTPPVITILSPEERDYLITEMLIVNFSVVESESAIENVSASLNNTPVVNGDTFSSTSLSAGINILTINASNTAGLNSSATISFQVLSFEESLYSIYYNATRDIDELTIESKHTIDAVLGDVSEQIQYNFYHSDDTKILDSIATEGKNQLAGIVSFSKEELVAIQSAAVMQLNEIVLLAPFDIQYHLQLVMGDIVEAIEKDMAISLTNVMGQQHATNKIIKDLIYSLVNVILSSIKDKDKALAAAQQKEEDVNQWLKDNGLEKVYCEGQDFIARLSIFCQGNAVDKEVSLMELWSAADDRELEHVEWETDVLPPTYNYKMNVILFTAPRTLDGVNGTIDNPNGTNGGDGLSWSKDFSQKEELIVIALGGIGGIGGNGFELFQHNGEGGKGGNGGDVNIEVGSQSIGIGIAGDGAESGANYVDISAYQGGHGGSANVTGGVNSVAIAFGGAGERGANQNAKNVLIGSVSYNYRDKNGKMCSIKVPQSTGGAGGAGGNSTAIASATGTAIAIAGEGGWAGDGSPRNKLDETLKGGAGTKAGDGGFGGSSGKPLAVINHAKASCDVQPKAQAFGAKAGNGGMGGDGSNNVKGGNGGKGGSSPNAEVKGLAPAEGQPEYRMASPGEAGAGGPSGEPDGNPGDDGSPGDAIIKSIK